MKRYRLREFNASLFIYLPEEKERFCKDYSLTIDDDDDGMSCGNGIWIGNPCVDICCHEVSHYVDWIVDERLRMPAQKLIATTELRAYLVGNLSAVVYEYVNPCCV